MLLFFTVAQLGKVVFGENGVFSLPSDGFSPGFSLGVVLLSGHVSPPAEEAFELCMMARNSWTGRVRDDPGSSFHDSRSWVVLLSCSHQTPMQTWQVA